MRKQDCNTDTITLNESLDLETRLFADFQSGDINAFSRIYDLYINVLFNYGCKLTLDKELLKDCIHDIFVKIYMRRDTLGDISNFKSYLFISLKNKLCDEMRRRVYMSDTPVEDFTDVSSDDNVEESYIVRETKKKDKNIVGNILEQLSPRQKEALTLYYIEEKKYDDICVIMNMNYQSVRNLMHRGLVKLRTLV
ncbi:sigma-70 family RNA polymerase sigma factor [uncultured Bacteroides sp.]|uniref:RNA polymerase sigma factor n=1 Tax=uncultured Bacteroides sp. TaxID=162156 RepID=UPI002AAC10D0|nr:sigma-70 family RNA polymerase sigma factor [uncultured Bacteroides sp.]